MVVGRNDSLGLFFSLETAAVDAPAALAATAGEAVAKIIAVAATTTTAPIIKPVLCFLINHLALLHCFFIHPLHRITSVCVERMGKVLLAGDKKEKEQSSWDSNS